MRCIIEPPLKECHTVMSLEACNESSSVVSCMQCLLYILPHVVGEQKSTHLTALLHEEGVETAEAVSSIYL